MQTTIFPRSWVRTLWAVSVAAFHGVAITMSSASDAPALSLLSIERSRSGHASMMESRTSMARYFEREPRVTSCPTEASRAANAIPAGPVAPRSPMCMREGYGAGVASDDSKGAALWDCWTARRS